MLFQCNDGDAKQPQYYVKQALSILFNVKAGGIYAYHWTLKGLINFIIRFQ
jgi:hypothetical protein